ncbi:lysophospholipase A [Diplocarpon rosae]|nr:lysophospholipase A [Diplocarpon rosae]
MKLQLGTWICSSLGLSLALPNPTPPPAFRWEDVNFLLAFGDSYTYVQGAAGRENYSFIGDRIDYSFTPQTLLTNQILSNQTSAGGPNWVEYLTRCFSGLPSTCARQLWDFAFAGADVSTTYSRAPVDNSTPLHHNYTVSFEDQVTQWSLYAQPILPVDVSRALVAVFIGINDILDTAASTFPRNDAPDLPSLYRQMIDAEFASVEGIYAAGYRHFLFLNLPPLDRTVRYYLEPAWPGNQVRAEPRPSATMIRQYNRLIASDAAAFAASHPGSSAWVFDTYSYLAGILDKPSAHGLKNTTSFCPSYNAPDIATNYAAYGCLPLGEYFWYDSVHITDTVHRHLAQAVEKFLLSQSR